MADAWQKWRKLTHVSWGTLIGGLLLLYATASQISVHGMHRWVASDSALLVAIGALLLGVYDRLHFLNRQACEVTDIIDAVTTDPNDRERGPFFSLADAWTIRGKVGLSTPEDHAD